MNLAETADSLEGKKASVARLRSKLQDEREGLKAQVGSSENVHDFSRVPSESGPCGKEACLNEVASVTPGRVCTSRGLSFCTLMCHCHFGTSLGYCLISLGPVFLYEVGTLNVGERLSLCTITLPGSGGLDVRCMQASSSKKYQYETFRFCVCLCRCFGTIFNS